MQSPWECHTCSVKYLRTCTGVLLVVLGLSAVAPQVQAQSSSLCREPTPRHRSSDPTTTTSSTTTTSVPKTNYSSQTLFFLGDSLSIGTEVIGKMSAKLLELGIWNRILADCKIGRTITGGTNDLQKRLAKTRSITAIVVALGTNDLQSRTESAYPRFAIDLMMAQAQGLPVLWVNIAYDKKLHPDYDRRAQKFNKALLLARSTYPNLYVANWYDAASKGFSKYERDGLHLMPGGYRDRTEFLVPTISRFWKKYLRATPTTPTALSTLHGSSVALSY